MLRLISVAVLLLTAAAVLWLKPATCSPSATSALSKPGAQDPSAQTSARASTKVQGQTRTETRTQVQSQAQASGQGAEGKDPAAGEQGARAIPPGSVGVPIRLADPTALALVRPGNRVDLLRLEADKDRTTPVASAALVLEVTGADDPVLGGLLLALPPEEARHTIAASGRGFAIMIRPD